MLFAKLFPFAKRLIYMKIRDFLPLYETKITILQPILLPTFYLEPLTHHCLKSVCIRSFFGLYSVRIPGNMDLKISEYGHFSRGAY